MPTTHFHPLGYGYFIHNMTIRLVKAVDTEPTDSQFWTDFKCFLVLVRVVEGAKNVWQCQSQCQCNTYVRSNVIWTLPSNAVLNPAQVGLLGTYLNLVSTGLKQGVFNAIDCKKTFF